LILVLTARPIATNKIACITAKKKAPTKGAFKITWETNREESVPHNDSL